MTGRLPLLVALLFAVSVNAAVSAETYRVSKIGVTGATLHIGHFASANPDCTPSGKTFVRISVPPNHGVVTMREGFGFTWFPKLLLCNSRRVRGVTVEYRPERGFTGSDSMELDVISQSGSEALMLYNITIK